MKNSFVKYGVSQCTYRCVVLPDGFVPGPLGFARYCLNAPTGAWCSLTHRGEHLYVLVELSQCTYRCVVLPDTRSEVVWEAVFQSQCTYRCVVLPDLSLPSRSVWPCAVSMHLQVRGAP